MAGWECADYTVGREGGRVGILLDEAMVINQLYRCRASPWKITRNGATCGPIMWQAQVLYPVTPSGLEVFKLGYAYPQGYLRGILGVRDRFLKILQF